VAILYSITSSKPSCSARNREPTAVSNTPERPSTNHQKAQNLYDIQINSYSNVVARSDKRATRVEGIATRRRILDHASALFVHRGLAGVTVKAIADAADVFPSQITYYFGTKEQLFAEAACREVLHIGSAVEKAGLGAENPKAFVSAIVSTALEAPSLLLFAEAMSIARFDADLQAQVRLTLDRLHDEGARAVATVLDANGWHLRTSPILEARAFWATVVGVALQQAAVPGGADPGTAEAVVSLFFNLHPKE